MVAAFHGSRAQTTARPGPRIIPQALTCGSINDRQPETGFRTQNKATAPRGRQKKSPRVRRHPPTQKKRPQRTNAGNEHSPRQTQSPRTTRRASTARPSGRSSRSRSSRPRRAGRYSGTAAGAAQTTRPPLFACATRRGSVTLPAGRAPAGRPPRRARPARQKDAFRRAAARGSSASTGTNPRSALSRRHPARASARSPRPCR